MAEPLTRASVCECGDPATGEVVVAGIGWASCLPCGVRKVALYCRLGIAPVVWRRDA